MHACYVALVVSDSLPPRGLEPASLLCPWDSPGRNTGVGCHALLQGIFPTQGSNLWLLCCRRIFATEPPGKGHSIGRVFINMCVCVCVCVCIENRNYLLSLLQGLHKKRNDDDLYYFYPELMY